MSQINLIKNHIKTELDQSRYQHTISVSYIAAALAMKYEIPIEDAQIAGLLHDCAKCIPNDEKFEICMRENISITPIEQKFPHLLHGKIGGMFAVKKFHIENTDIINAVIFHTTGRPKMSELEKIIFVADYIEPYRKNAPNLAHIRKTAFEDLDEAVFLILKDTMKHLSSLPISGIDETTNHAYDYYKKKRKDSQ